MTADPTVSRPTRTATWNLLRDGATVASAYAVCRPDRRWFVSVDAWDAADHAPLVHAMVADLGHDLHTRLDAADDAALELWSRYGFVPHRREVEYVLDPGAPRPGVRGVRLPPGLVLLPADQVEGRALRELDEELRHDVPGQQAWVNDPAEFVDQVFDERRFDPSLFLVAADEAEQRFAGLVRLARLGDRARVALVGVTRPYRRRGLARAMLDSALQGAAELGLAAVLAEVDADDRAGSALLRAAGATETGASVVLRRAAAGPGA